jgi:CHAD domain-containing protein
MTETAVVTEEAPKKKGLLAVAREEHGELLKLLEKAWQEGAMEVELVHDLRVATRRLEEVSGLLEELMDEASVQAVGPSLKEVRRAAGELRDLDVMREHLLGGGKWRTPAVLHQVAVELAEVMLQRRAGLVERLREVTRAPSVMGTVVILSRVMEVNEAAERRGAAEERLQAALEKRLARREKGVRRAFGRAAMKQTAKSLHEARIAAKKLRYVEELLEEGCDDKGAGKRVKFLKRVQQVLGDHHDVEVVEEALEAEVAKRHERRLGAAWRGWKKRKEREQGKRAAEFFVRSYGWMNG